MFLDTIIGVVKKGREILGKMCRIGSLRFFFWDVYNIILGPIRVWLLRERFQPLSVCGIRLVWGPHQASVYHDCHTSLVYWLVSSFISFESWIPGIREQLDKSTVQIDSRSGRESSWENVQGVGTIMKRERNEGSVSMWTNLTIDFALVMLTNNILGLPIRVQLLRERFSTFQCL